MKTSTKFLTGLFLALVVAMFGAAVSLRHQYNGIDKSDPYARWQKKPLGTFRAVSIQSASPITVQIERGDVPRLLQDTLRTWQKTDYTYKVERDTLFLTLRETDGWKLNPNDENDEEETASLIVQTPSLDALQTTNTNCQLGGLQGNSLTIQQRGQGGRVRLGQVTYQQLSAALMGKCQLTVAAFNNKIGQASITLRDSSRLHQYSDFSDGLTLDAAPAASLHLTGKTIAQMAGQ